ncbi:MAG: hypothetical protein QNK37_03960 [Acidobacteriota bacterium]|nr:hypothetical protein [Acidobacteriota bacterium]
MRVLVMAELFETIIEKEDIQTARRRLSLHVEEVIKPSCKLEMAGVFADGRAPFFIMDVDSSSELMRLLGGPLLDCFRVTTRPICSFEELAEVFGS